MYLSEVIETSYEVHLCWYRCVDYDCDGSGRRIVSPLHVKTVTELENLGQVENIKTSENSLIEALK